MDEYFLHYIWKLQKFDRKDLKTSDGRSVVVFNRGNHNHDSGPDFEEARIKIEEIEWAGNVEIHLKSSDWIKHNHQKDKSYDNVILHVVWKHDRQVLVDGQEIPTLQLSDRTDPRLLVKYKSFLQNSNAILCGDQIQSISSVTYNNALDKSMIERLEEKASEMQVLLSKNKNDWEHATYLSLARNFGFSTNKESFFVLASSLPFKIISKYFRNPKSVEALLFGQAGFLEKEGDSYQKELKKEYQYLQKKHRLDKRLSQSSWKFGRMRPANFPTVRIAQFVAFLSANSNLFSKFIDIQDSKHFPDQHKVEISEYWKKHYDFGKPRKKESRNIGKSTYQNVIINTIAPTLVAYASYSGDQRYTDKAIRLLESIPAEQNKIIQHWKSINRNPKNAFDSQALIGLYKNYCSRKKCLNCNIGVELLSK